jgi:hypothetical protein
MKNSEEKPWLRPGKKPFKPKALPKKEREGVQRLAASIDDTFSHINKKTDIERDVERLNNSHRKSNKIARAIVGGIYDLYLYYQSDTSKQQALYRDCAKASIRLTAAMDLPTVIARYTLRDLRPAPTRERLCRYTAAAREAARQRVPLGKLAAHLAKKGNSIKAMAAKFAASRLAAPHAPKSTRPISLRCNTEIREKIKRYRKAPSFWLRVKPAETGALTVDKVRRRRTSSSRTENRI